jgi:calcineurin-like phosphoesterase family protein
MYFFTSDWHIGHANIIKFCNRPFRDVREMEQELIERHNSVVTDNDIVIHAGDFAFRNTTSVDKYQAKLNGNNIFLKGSHDKWNKHGAYLWEGMIEDHYVVVCHYAMLSWPRSHYGSWQLFGHSHGNQKGHNVQKQYDIGVDSNNYYPVSFDYLKVYFGQRDRDTEIEIGKMLDV